MNLAGLWMILTVLWGTMKKSNQFHINRFFWPIIALLVLVIGAIWTNAGVVGPGIPQPSVQGNLPPIALGPVPALQENNPSGQGAALMMQEAISHVASMVRPAVVSISGAVNTQAPSGSGLTYLNPYPGGSGLVGSGVIIDRRGYVLTTFRTVGRATQVRVSLFSGTPREYMADVVNVDPNTDLALLRINAREIFPTVILGNSDLLEVGDLVLAVGSPFGFARTVTMGIVSSNRRGLNIDGIRYPDMIQTDATINEGNDGGPLVNIRGEVVGINMAIYRPNNQFTGISFALPINDVMGFINANLG